MSNRLTPTDWKTLVRIFEADGFKYDRTHGSHMAFIKAGIPRPLIIPRYDEVPVFIISGLLRTAGMSRERFLELMRNC